MKATIVVWVDVDMQGNKMYWTMPPGFPPIQGAVRYRLMGEVDVPQPAAVDVQAVAIKEEQK